DAAVAGRVELDHVDRARALRGEIDARGTFAARIRRRPLLAVERAGHDARAGRLTAASRAGEQVRVVDPPGRQRGTQRFRHVLLADDLGEGRRSVLAIQRESHGAETTAACRRFSRPGVCLEPGRREVRPRPGSARSGAVAARAVSGPRTHRRPAPGQKGTPAPVRACLSLLPSGPGEVHRVDVAGVRLQCRRVRRRRRTAGAHFCDGRLLRKSANVPPSRSPSGPSRFNPASKARPIFPGTGTRTTRRRRPIAALYSSSSSARDCTRGPPMSRARPTGLPKASSATRPATCSTSIDCTANPRGTNATGGAARAATIRSARSWNWVARCTVYGTPESAISRS